MKLERIALRVVSVIGFGITAGVWALGLCGWVCAGAVLLAYLAAFLMTVQEPVRAGAPESRPYAPARRPFATCQCVEYLNHPVYRRCMRCGGDHP